MLDVQMTFEIVLLVVLVLVQLKATHRTVVKIPVLHAVSYIIMYLIYVLRCCYKLLYMIKGV